MFESHFVTLKVYLKGLRTTLRKQYQVMYLLFAKHGICVQKIN